MSGVKEKTPLILIVDDDFGLRLLMRASLEKDGFRVAEAENGLVAVSVFEKLQPDAILLDVMMPKLDGFDTCKTVRKMTGGIHTPILMVTGLEDLESIHRAFESGATDFITKPINWPVLNYRVKYMLRASNAFFDVIDQRKQIEVLAFYDHLTGLANRTMFKDSLDTALIDSAAEESQLAVLFMDLDRFKIINDTLGHHVGDILLKNVAGRVSTCIRDSDSFSRYGQDESKSCVSRLGGDEFTIMLPRLQTPEDASRVAQRIKNSLSHKFTIEGHEIFISASIGISIFPLDGNDSEVLMKHADLAMYHAKEKGKNGFQFYKKALNVKAKVRLDFENDVRKAVTNDEFVLWYQPQVDMRDGQIVGAESLARWTHPTLGQVPPSDFIPSIEELGLIVPFTDWVIRRVGEQQQAWKEQGYRQVRVAVNISSKQFAEQHLPQKLRESLEGNHLKPNAFEVEITESVMAEKKGETEEILEEIKKMGLTISVDDFGTGYSSLLYLKNFPISSIKIDRFFVKDIIKNPQDAAIIQAIIALAKSLGMTTIAEGIETSEQFKLLRSMGCDIGQGYFFSPPVPEEAFAQLVKDDFCYIETK
ncbi:diguanylate cyclase (GGDEF) domain-containing protein [Desulfocapsa sulfexigens DSM 10523]|uniref:Diguanylate cyclase (GGDEF) domain-containing protein n=1 Tax=Desulfocapsa sulfexigens (strain DSM 10523 / SB164P1) TaxID=1167006 RepID=M1PLF8_DESSD|nr:EAL domain-containing protein [Desulfocapsa sulfexigens]AGF77306.1 diguanylate cyclase (GGDEF) domain-containing protein [Desulfocapsa sulfexigens DSM 10523]